MTAILYLIPVSVFLGLLALIGFIWTVQTNQYDDLEGEKYRVIGDDEAVFRVKEPDNKNNLS